MALFFECLLVSIRPLWLFACIMCICWINTNQVLQIIRQFTTIPNMIINQSNQSVIYLTQTIKSINTEHRQKFTNSKITEN